MPEGFLHNFRMNTLRQEECGAGVPEIIHPHLPQFCRGEHVVKCASDVSVIERRSNARSEDQINHQIESLSGKPSVQNSTRSFDSCQHNHCVEWSHQRPQLRDPHAWRFHNRSVEPAAAKTLKGAKRWERSSGSIAESAGKCGPDQQKDVGALSRVPFWRPLPRTTPPFHGRDGDSEFRSRGSMGQTCATGSSPWSMRDENAADRAGFAVPGNSKGRSAVCARSAAP